MVVTIIFIAMISLHDREILYSDDTTFLVTDTGWLQHFARWYIFQWFPRLTVVGQRDTLQKLVVPRKKAIQKCTSVHQYGGIGGQE